MNYALPIFLAVAASLAVAGILTAVLQFFADGWQLPTRNKLAALPVETREQRKKQIPIVFVVSFVVAIILLVLCWHLGATP
jgi:ABC-type multidrug transport system permease subunit